MNVVLDASAGIVLSAGATHRHLRDRVAEATWLGSPALYDYEVTNAVWKYRRSGGGPTSSAPRSSAAPSASSAREQPGRTWRARLLRWRESRFEAIGPAGVMPAVVLGA